jgi:CheY-like chemotaxis protein
MARVRAVCEIDKAIVGVVLLGATQMKQYRFAASVVNRPRSVLIVDGDADARLLYRLVLSDLTAAVAEAEDGAEALGKAICGRPDVVVTDTRLSRIDGYELCSLLRQDEATRAASIVVVTAQALPEDVTRAFTAGADEVLVKPFLPDDVVAAACRTWRRRARPMSAHD